MTKRTLLIDADVVAYKCASAAEVAVEWEDGYWTWGCDFEEVTALIDSHIAKLMDRFKADAHRLCLTDREGNFRKEILPTYKGSRANTKKPLVLKAVNEWLVEERGAYWRPKLEGDDIMGIFATWPKVKGEKIIVSIDKDMKTIPGLYCKEPFKGVNPMIFDITEEEADYWHLYQTLTGDVTDGYSGCPGVGPEAAEKALTEMTKLIPYEHELKRGPRKGETETRYHAVETDDPWEVVLSRFKAAGLNEKVALEQARVARILRASDYDFKNKEPILWTPSANSVER